MTATPSNGKQGPRRGPFSHLLLAFAGLLLFAGFVALGNWQLERRVWKLDLIERVNSRVDATAVAAPARDDLQAVRRERDEYRHVVVRGRFVPGREFRVSAATGLGAGHWVLTPFERTDGSTVFINRGFVAQGGTAAPPPAFTLDVSGLLRLNEPDGGVLRENVPAEGRWYSRDAVAMGEVAGLREVAPFFIDAGEGQPGSPGGDGPVGGLTVIDFNNNHLVYALTWYGLASMVLLAAAVVWKESRNIP